MLISISAADNTLAGVAWADDKVVAIPTGEIESVVGQLKLNDVAFPVQE